MTLLYVASPYSHPDARMRNDRAEAAAYFTAKLMQYRAVTAYSPIVHGHRVADHLPQNLVENHGFWMRQCIDMLRRCDWLLVLPIPGWRESKGMAMEIEFAETAGIPIYVLQSREFDCEWLTFEELKELNWQEYTV